MGLIFQVKLSMMRYFLRIDMNACKGHILIANPQQNQHLGDLRYLVHDILGDLMIQKFPESEIYGSPPLRIQKSSRIADLHRNSSAKVNVT